MPLDLELVQHGTVGEQLDQQGHPPHEAEMDGAPMSIAWLIGLAIAIVAVAAFVVVALRSGWLSICNCSDALLFSAAAFPHPIPATASTSSSDVVPSAIRP